MSATMTKMEFKRLAQIYGGDLLRWPETVRRAAGDFQLQNPQSAKAILDRQTDVDHALAQVPHQDINVDLETQILRSFPAAAAQRSSNHLWAWSALLHPIRGGMPAWGMALALLLVSGFIGGYTGYAYTLNQSGSADIIADAFGTIDDTLFVEDPTT